MMSQGFAMRILAALTALALAAVVPSRAQTPSWSLTATVAESCSCTVSCPCNFGGEPSHMPCEGNRMIVIDKGHYQDVDLAGVQLLVTFNMRNWSKIYVSDTVSERQMKAVEAMLPLAFAGFHKGMLSFTKAPITMTIADTRVRFSGPESSVDMELVKGFNGQAIRINNLPSAVFQEYTQYRSVSHTHSSNTHTWNHKGTNGFTSKWSAASK
jgi:hypothetical protein